MTTLGGEENKPPLKELLFHKRYMLWSLSVQCMRAPSIMTSLAFIIISYYATGSYALGGLMVTVYTVGLILFAVPGGRFVDKLGIAKGLPFLLLGSSLMFFLLLLATIFKAPSWILIVLAGFSSACLAGAAGGFRTLLSRVIPKRLIPSAVAIDATMIEVVVVTAPLVVSIIATFWESGAAIAMATASLVSAILAYSLARGTENNKAENESNVTESYAVPKSLWLNPRYIFWVLASVAFGHALGTAETGAFPISKSLNGGPNTAAILIGIVSVFSIVSGLLYASLEKRIKLSKFLQANLMLFVIVSGCFGLYASQSWPVVVISLILIGTCTAPLMILRSQAIEDEIPDDRKSEGFSVVGAAHSVGFGLSGIFLSILPLKGMLVSGAISGLVVILLAPILLSNKLYQKATALPADSSNNSASNTVK
ncbi:MFS transporter [Brevibacillus sp. TJ4]|uniref:MFS transporter n=1 Tax=Brevibacillus sp. TJ4 TaxID=3234853 RepID=UPI0037D5E612